jgi:hypothetical protein
MESRISSGQVFGQEKQWVWINFAAVQKHRNISSLRGEMRCLRMNGRFAPKAVIQQLISFLLPYQSRTNSILGQTLSIRTDSASTHSLSASFPTRTRRDYMPFVQKPYQLLNDR